MTYLEERLRAYNEEEDIRRNFGYIDVENSKGIEALYGVAEQIVTLGNGLNERIRIQKATDDYILAKAQQMLKSIENIYEEIMKEPTEEEIL